jgi:hypothetical protein
MRELTSNEIQNISGGFTAEGIVLVALGVSLAVVIAAPVIIPLVILSRDYNTK